MSRGKEPAEAGGLATALRRVVIGYRVVGALWLWLLAVLVLVTEPAADAGLVVGTGVLATVWTLATVAVGTRAPVFLRSWPWLAADIAMSAGIVWLSAEAGSERGFTGGYPFSTVLLAAYGGGYPGGFGAAIVLSAVSFRLISSEAVSSSLVYLAGAGVIVWAIGVMRRYERERRSLEARLATEQAERARSQERAETGAALHDSVLQTLALIQRRSDDPAAVAALARRQERDLRDWLSGSGRLGGAAAATLAQALKDVSEDVESHFPITVDLVTVGDADLDEPLESLVAAAREAMVNAAKHSGVASASVYAEVTADEASVFVRDRGAGFEASAVGEGRHGLRDSIYGRMQRCGGSASVTSRPGSGTEVELRLPRRQAP